MSGADLQLDVSALSFADVAGISALREYGSGCPGLPARSVSGRDFPFVFWPIVWQARGYGAPYLYDPEVRLLLSYLFT